MIKVEIEYNGKKYDDLEQPLLQASLDGIRELVANQLESFHDQINKEGAIITIIPQAKTIEELSEGKVRIELRNASDDLIKKIKSVLPV